MFAVVACSLPFDSGSGDLLVHRFAVVRYSTSVMGKQNVLFEFTGGDTGPMHVIKLEQ